MFDQANYYIMKQLFNSKSRKYFFIATIILCIFGLVLTSNQSDQFYISLILRLSLAPIYFFYSVFLFWLVDNFFLKRRYGLFTLLYIFFSIFAAYLCNLAELKEYNVIGIQGNFIGILFVGGFAIILRNAKRKVGRKVELQDYKDALNQAEIKLLKDQLSPHFLFNTLNSIYYHCLADPQKASEMILKLSDLYRYQSDSLKLKSVKLDDEIAFITNYVEFEKNRIHQGIKFEFTNNVQKSNYCISPNIIITLVENCFKHFSRDSKDPFIIINITLSKNVFTLKTYNSYNPEFLNTSGTSMTNLIQRLDFMYENKYNFEIDKDNFIYKTLLKIKL
jgi:sensor histidine kinase YesM